MADELNIKPKGLENIPSNKKIPDELKRVNVPEKPVEIDLEAKDALPIIKKQLEDNLLDTLKSGWSIKHLIGLVLTIITFIALIIISKCS